MLREFVWNDLVAETEWLDRSVFHLDGPDAIRHLGTLFELPKLHAIQWVPGEKLPRESVLKWIPLLRCIQAANRAIHLSVQPEEVEPLLLALAPEGLLLRTACDTEEEAKDLVRRVEKLSRPGKHF